MQLNNPPTALHPVRHNDFDHAQAMSEVFPRMEDRSRLYISTIGQLAKPWHGQALDGPEIALAIRTTPAVDHRPPQVIGAAASNGQRVVTILAGELPNFLEVHKEKGLIVANGGQVFWTLVQCCEQADESPEVLWNQIGLGRITDVMQLDLLMRLPRPTGELLMPRALYDIAAEMAIVHTLPNQPRAQLEQLMTWRTTRAKYDEMGFVAGEAHGLFLCATLLRQLRMLYQPPLFASAEKFLTERSFEGLQRLLLRASAARQRIYFHGIACNVDDCNDHRTMLLMGADDAMGTIVKQPETKELFPENIEGQSADNVRMDGRKLLKLLAAMRRKNAVLPEIPNVLDADHLNTNLLTIFAMVEPAMRSVVLLRGDLRFREDLRVGEDGRVHMRFVSLPHLGECPSVFDHILQNGYSRMLRTCKNHALLLVRVGLDTEMDQDLRESLVLSAGLELLKCAYRVVAHFGDSLIVEVNEAQIAEPGQRAAEKIVLDHVTQQLNPRERVEVACRRMCGWEGVEDALQTEENRLRLGKLPL